ncbi:hypothetical protein [Pseudomonas syringae group sp. J309-1]|uniref:hypothetical protein n=1 Tax=Pseudomonas syringae group sp. J309-1 TaxID=3079588 RepID=UPI00290CE6B1|nr:hypothetical protein [Pseudomonas syringae group sp. J309-1]MDU8358132.1 hypothetical protein [Pseudomonas syringae group sp. J309-1]
MKKKKYAIVPAPLLERLSVSIDFEAIDISQAKLELRELLSEATELPFTTDLQFILSRPGFGCQPTAQVLRKLGHEIAERTEAEQAATIHWLLNHYLRDPQNWRKNSLDQFNAAAATLNNPENDL